VSHFVFESHPRVPSANEVSRWRKELNLVRDEILTAAGADIGRSLNEEYLIEWSTVDSAFDFLQSEGLDALAPKTVKSRLKKALGQRWIGQRRIPYGTVLIAGTWNFPVALHLVQILFAAAAGNKAVFKPSPLTKNFTKALATHLPRILGAERFEIFDPLEPSAVLDAIRARNFDLVLFTGGTQGAQVFAKACAEAFVPFIPEASGGEAALLLRSLASDDRKLEQEVDHLLWAAFHNSGQTCVSPRFWLVPSDIGPKVFEMATRMLELYVDTLKSRPPLRSEAVRQELSSWLEWAKTAGLRKSYASTVRPEFSLHLANSLPTVSGESPPCFGPGVLIVPYNSIGEAAQWVRKNRWSLMTALFGSPQGDEQNILDQLDTSIVSSGEAITAVGDAAVPFGGRGASGWGVTHGLEGLMQLSRSQSFVEVRSWPGLQSLRPTWSKLPALLKAGAWLKDIETSPVKTIRRMLGHEGQKTT
jgi:acyl-CoA reductase-like NAD-dependent aldehyde dehydrogenase